VKTESCYIVLGAVALAIAAAAVVFLIASPLNSELTTGSNPWANPYGGYEVTKESSNLYQVIVDARIGDFEIIDENNQTIFNSKTSIRDPTGREFPSDVVYSHLGGCFRAHVPQPYWFYSNTTPASMIEWDFGENGIEPTWHTITVGKKETRWIYCDENGFCEER